MQNPAHKEAGAGRKRASCRAILGEGGRGQREYDLVHPLPKPQQRGKENFLLISSSQRATPDNRNSGDGEQAGAGEVGCEAEGTAS